VFQGGPKSMIQTLGGYLDMEIQFISTDRSVLGGRDKHEGDYKGNWVFR
jgi:hypothetical protein